jgi:hypothetical protein
MKYVNKAQAKKITGLSYLGGINTSAKIAKSGLKGEMTYIVYLAPANLSGWEVCPGRSPECTAACLHASGHNRMDQEGRIDGARIKKTKLFFEHREFFMNWLVDEIRAAKKKAEKSGMSFSVRFNGTSDISPEILKLNGQCVLDLFNDVQWYDYTKVANRFTKLSKYSNYDLTYSYSGYNWEECKNILDMKIGRVAMVFADKLPDTYLGYKVVDGDESDIRYEDERGVIVGLKFKRVRAKIDLEKNKFIVASSELS